MKVFVSQRIFPEAISLLRQSGVQVETNDSNVPLSREEFIGRAKGADALICLLTDTIDNEILQQIDPKIIANVAVGYDNIDVDAATKYGILVTNTPGVLEETTADLTFALILATARRILEAENHLRQGKFDGWELFQPYLGLDVWGKTLGIVGMGRIGRAVARRAHGFDMRIFYYNREAIDTAEENLLGAKLVTFNRLLSESDFISIHVPLNETTQHLFSEHAFQMMKRSAILINTSRGPVVDEIALTKALQNREIRGAGLDVFEWEPNIYEFLLQQRTHVVLLPHVGSATLATRCRMSILAAENALAGLQGQRPRNLINPEALQYL